MTENNFQTLLDGVNTGTSTVVDICKNYNEQDPSPTITDEQLNNHPFFTKYFSTELSNILQQWFSEGSLDENQTEIFQVCSQFLLKLTKTDSNTKQWLNQQTELINLTEQCLNEIGAYGYYIGIDAVEDSSLESLDSLIQAFEHVQCQQLLEVLAKCITSRFYTDAFYRLSNDNASFLTITQRFLLITCPNYIITCDTEKAQCLKIVTKMLISYDELFAEFLPHIEDWDIPVMSTLIYPIKLILSVIRLLTLEQKQFIYQVILTILLNKSTIKPNIEQIQLALVYTSLCLLIDVMRSDKDLIDHLKNKTGKKSDLIVVLNNLSTNEYSDIIRLKALALVSLLVTEEEFLAEDKTKEVTGLFVKNFTEALEDGKTKEVDEILSGLRDLVQNDAVKEEVMKQNGLPSIIKYAKETKDDPLPLEITYAMTFNADAKKVINQDQEFVDHIKELRSSEKRGVSRMAHGIVWKLEGEEKFRNTKEEKKLAKKEDPENKSEESSDQGKEKYDMMISYCWAQKELCHKINDRLEKDGFNVWLDRDEMHGSIIESMAEAIENARFILLCMSSNYKNSINCKAEAEYAFNRKSKIIPLIVEPKYTADGWLGFLAGSKIYVDFADKEDEEFDKAYDLLIAELERNGLREPDEDKKKDPATSTATEAESKPVEESKTEEEAKPAPIQTTEYLNVGPASMWNDVHVNEFLADNQLEQFIPICQSMDGGALIEFLHSCETIPDKLYGLVNSLSKEHPISLGTFFKFISRLKKYLPPKVPRKLYFQYDYIYPSSATTATAATTTTTITKTDDVK